MKVSLLAALASSALSLEQVVLVGLYEADGVSIKSFAVEQNGLKFIGDNNVGGKDISWITPAIRSSGDVTSVFAVSETGNTIASLELLCDGGMREPRGPRISVHDAPVYLAVKDKASSALGDAPSAIAANYGAGSVDIIPVYYSKDGTAKLGEVTQTMDFGADAHAHSAYFAGGSVYVPTLGLDQVQQLQFKGSQLQQAHTPLAVPATQGPRHMAFHPSLPIAVLANEGAADSKVTIELLAIGKDGTLSEVESYPAAGPYAAPDMYPAEIRFSPNGEFVVVSVRDATEQKRDGIAVFKVENGKSLSAVGYTSTGHYPRSMALTDQGLLIVGNQKDNSLTLLQMNLATGSIMKVTSDLPLGNSPAFVGVFETGAACESGAVV